MKTNMFYQSRRRVCSRLILLTALVSNHLPAAETVFQPHDVVALVGGEDIVALSESGQLEAQMIRQPGLAGVKVRALAYEGDTVFEQHRQLNFPAWEEQLKQIGATVVIAQFGQMEALQQNRTTEEFIQQYAALLKRMSAGNRTLVILSPTPFEKPPPPLPDLTPRNLELQRQLPRLHALAETLGAAFVDLTRSLPEGGALTRDGIHLNESGLRAAARIIVKQLGLKPAAGDDPALLELLAEKNRLWFNYHRPQNWAFLHGDRTEQPSSRDHRDPSIRWFPGELEQYLPLIDAKEKEIINHLRGIQAEKN